ncbi:hypothetical protein SAMN05421823_109191 [Catalinimonas alkaloidigena]|uniref:Uncharacterized protein n=1 Tax=Catalinimonas alkaloidigena TaxID=1075417 RepID=A0A1G9PH09_9BACT|nr:hypothetical protein [Catalinimonas alkaloidigena]SDL98014.1 hypothetical protein SAMN05421823_109191 [Catalinimonas alkaloidigena]
MATSQDQDPTEESLSAEFTQFINDMMSGRIGSVVNDRPGDEPETRVKTIDVDGKLYRIEIDKKGEPDYLTVYDSMEAYIDGDEPIDEIAL